MNGLFKLNTIHVDNGYRKEMLFTTELTQYIDTDKVCDTASKMSELLFNTYPFDEKYKKLVDIIFNPQQNDSLPYTLGQMEQYEEDGESHIACYLKYKE